MIVSGNAGGLAYDHAPARTEGSDTVAVLLHGDLFQLRRPRPSLRLGVGHPLVSSDTSIELRLGLQLPRNPTQRGG